MHQRGPLDANERKSGNLAYSPFHHCVNVVLVNRIGDQAQPRGEMVLAAGEQADGA